MKIEKKRSSSPGAIARVFVIVILAIGVLALSGCSDNGTTGDATNSTAPPTSSAGSYTVGGRPNVDGIAAKLLGLARTNGDNRPSSAFFVATTLDESTPVVSDGDEASDFEAPTKVYTFVVGGNFVAQNANRPSGAEAPKGKWLVGSLDRQSGELLDYGITSKDPTKAVKALGTPTDLGFGPPADN